MSTERFSSSDLFCIWKTEPCEAGDTLSGGENVAQLKRLGLIENTESGYVTTLKGRVTIQLLIEHLDKAKMALETKINVIQTNL